MDEKSAFQFSFDPGKGAVQFRAMV